MSYCGYIPFMFSYLSRIESPKILEIGVDKGQTLLPITHGLTLIKDSFSYVGVDIQFDQNLDVTMKYWLVKPQQNISILINNSLLHLKSDTTVYDLVLIDGDHNYETVSQELNSITKNNVHDNSVIIVDDYSGKYSNKDLYYSLREGYEDNELATKPKQLDKQGVGTAVDEFLELNKEWKLSTLVVGEPIILTKKFDFSCLNETK